MVKTLLLYHCHYPERRLFKGGPHFPMHAKIHLRLKDLYENSLQMRPLHHQLFLDLLDPEGLQYGVVLRTMLIQIHMDPEESYNLHRLNILGLQSVHVILR